VLSTLAPEKENARFRRYLRRSRNRFILLPSLFCYIVEVFPPNLPFHPLVCASHSPTNGTILTQDVASNTTPDDQAHPKFVSDCPAQHADPLSFTMQHASDTQPLADHGLHQTGAAGEEGISTSRIHSETPPEVSQRSKSSKGIHNLEPCQDQAISKPPVPHLRPLPTLPFALRTPIFLSTSPRSLYDHQAAADITATNFTESQGSEYPLSQLPQGLVHTKNSVEGGYSANLCTEFKNQWPARSSRSTMKYESQQANSEHRAYALQGTEHSFSVSRTLKSSGQSSPLST
jgi:hypothetical protein